MEPQPLGLEYALEHGNVDEGQLDNERGGDSCEQHLILGNTASQSTVLDSRCEVQEDEACESLKRVSIWIQY